MKAFGLCLNWKVVAGLALVAVGVWLFAPHLIGAALPLLVVAACPLSMFFMMRGMGNMGNPPVQNPTPHMDWPQLPGNVVLSDAERVADLHARVASIQAEQDAIAREIAALEAERSPVLRQAEAVARAAEEQQAPGAAASA